MYATVQGLCYYSVCSTADPTCGESPSVGFSTTHLVNLAKLILEKRPQFDEDDKLEIFNKNGQMYFLPASDNEQVRINSFEKWEEAFRIYASIFTKANPHRTIEIF